MAFTHIKQLRRRLRKVIWVEKRNSISSNTSDITTELAAGILIVEYIGGGKIWLVWEYIGV